MEIGAKGIDLQDPRRAEANYRVIQGVTSCQGKAAKRHELGVKSPETKTPTPCRALKSQSPTPTY